MQEPALPKVWSSGWEITVSDCPTGLAWSPDDGHLLAASLAGDVVRIDVEAGVPERIAEHAGGALCLTWAGNRMISGGQDGAVAIDGDRIDVGGWVAAVAASADGRRVAVAHGRDISMLDVGCTSPGLPHCDHHDTTVTCLRWHPASVGALVAGSFARISRYAVPPDAAVPAVFDVDLPSGGAIACVHPSATGWWAAGVRGNFAYLWNDTVARAPVEIPTGRWSGQLLGFSDGGDLMATASDQMTAVFDFHSADPLGMPTGMWLTSIGVPTALAWRPGSEQLITAVSVGRGADDNGLLVWEPRLSPSPLGFFTTTRPVEHLAWSSTGDLLAVAFSDGTISAGRLPVSTHR